MKNFGTIFRVGVGGGHSWERSKPYTQDGCRYIASPSFGGGVQASKIVSAADFEVAYTESLGHNKKAIPKVFFTRDWDQTTWGSRVT
jgi:hypothetical protein